MSSKDGTFLHGGNMAEYKTKQREMILDYMIKNKDIHVTAEMIINYFRLHGTPDRKSVV